MNNNQVGKNVRKICILPETRHTKHSQKKVMFQTKVCTKVGNSLFLNLVMIRKWTLFPVKIVNFQNAEMKFVFSWLGFKSKDMCLHELGDNGYECNK